MTVNKPCTFPLLRYACMLVPFLSLLLVYAMPPAALGTTLLLPKTGQTGCWDAYGNVVACASTGQDGDTRAGVDWPNQRFTDNGNGTVTDNLTGLIWLKNAGCTDTVGGIVRTGALPWLDALAWSNNLASGNCGLTDSSVAGDWRLPNVTEMESLADLSRDTPGLPTGHPFSSPPSSFCWTSTTIASVANRAWAVNMANGYVYGGFVKDTYIWVWPVRDGQ